MLAGIVTTLERIAKQILMLNRPEIAELGEPIPEGTVGSSPMPHKCNPVRCERTIALARLIRSQAMMMAEAMAGYDERDFDAWYAEFAIIPEACLPRAPTRQRP
jgi:adenylosuccinate lyase